MRLDLCRQKGELPKLVGHRGACDVAPENTMASFRRARQDGADIIELDVRLAGDRQVVVIHDAKVDRTTNGTGYVSDFTVAELQRLDAGAWFDARFAGERIPTLNEVLRWAKGRIALLLELKFEPFGGFDPGLSPRVVDLLKATQTMDQVAAISYQPRALIQLKALAPGIPVGPLQPRDELLQLAVWLFQRFPLVGRIYAIQHILMRPLAFTHGWGCDIVAPNIAAVTELLVRTAHQVRAPVSCGGLFWDYPAAIRIGVDTISANNPGLIRSLYL